MQIGHDTGLAKDMIVGLVEHSMVGHSTSLTSWLYMSQLNNWGLVVNEKLNF